MGSFEYNRARVFISYSHQDARWLKRLRVHLKPLELAYGVDVWDDTAIAPGSKWSEAIRDAVKSAQVALLLVSADFLASDFIRTDELPPLLAAADAEGATILPLVRSPCRFAQTAGLAQFQSLNPPSRPLTAMAKNEQEALFTKVANEVEKALKAQQAARMAPATESPSPRQSSASKRVSHDVRHSVGDSLVTVIATLHPYDIMSGKTGSLRQLNAVEGSLEAIEHVAASVAQQLAEAIEPDPVQEVTLQLSGSSIGASRVLAASVQILAGQGLGYIEKGEFGNAQTLDLLPLFNSKLSFSPDADSISLWLRDRRGRFNRELVEFYRTEDGFSFDPQAKVYNKSVRLTVKKTRMLIESFVAAGARKQVLERVSLSFDAALREKLLGFEALEIAALTQKELERKRKELARLPVVRGKGSLIDQYNVELVVTGTIVVAKQS